MFAYILILWSEILILLAEIWENKWGWGNSPELRSLITEGIYYSSNPYILPQQTKQLHFYKTYFPMFWLECFKSITGTWKLFILSHPRLFRKRKNLGAGTATTVARRKERKRAREDIFRMTPITRLSSDLVAAFCFVPVSDVRDKKRYRMPIILIESNKKQTTFNCFHCWRNL